MQEHSYGNASKKLDVNVPNFVRTVQKLCRMLSLEHTKSWTDIAQTDRRTSLNDSQSIGIIKKLGRS